MTLKKVISGDPLKINAETFNAMIDAAEAYKQQGAAASTQIFNKQNDGFVFVKNNTSTDVPRFGVLGLGVPIITPTNNLAEWQNNFSFIGTTPTTPTHVGKFGIAIEPIAAGKIGRVKIDGPTPVKINITDATHTHADIATTDVTKLTSSTTGDAKILWQETGTGIKWCLVLLGQPAAVASAGTARYRVKSEQNDTVTCVTWDGATEGTANVVIAKPWKLQQIVSHYELITVISASTIKTITVTDGATLETWEITPSYKINDEIFVAKNPTGGNNVSGSQGTDLNIDGRAWAVQ